MCRLVAYHGPKISMDRIVVAPSHSLLVQSQVAEEAKLAVNGDGFGLAWYANQKEPALYKDIMPAWANPNLLHICKSVETSNFIAHVRAATFGAASYQNCHPFTHGQWSFAHNGQIGGFAKLRRELENALPDDLYCERSGVTDSELFFLLAIANNLDKAPKEACKQTITMIADLHKKHKIKQALRLTFVLSNGTELFGCRYSSDTKAPTLYLSGSLDSGGIAIASEPLDGSHDNWQAVPPNHFVAVSNNSNAITPLVETV